jgi:transglutaminase-like putative cysteine protease
LGDSSAKDINGKKSIIGSKIILLGAAAGGVAIAGWFGLLLIDQFGNSKPKVAGYTIAKSIQYSYSLQNKTSRMIEDAQLWAHAPVKQTATQRCLDMSANYPFQVLTDDDGNQVLHFTFENLAPYASRIVTIKANLLLSHSANPIDARPLAVDLSPETNIESDHQAIRRAAARLKEPSGIKTVKAVFHWVANHVQYSGYSNRDRGALFALEQKEGDCTEFMDLFVALCRANGLPARRIGGYLSPENAVLKARDYHNWGEFYDGGTWQIADPQNKILMQNQDEYIAMRIIRDSGDNPLGTFNRFRVSGKGLKARMN